MKLRLPHKFQAALMAALASVSFTTLSSGTIAVATGAALLAGQQAQAEVLQASETLATNKALDGVTGTAITLGGMSYANSAGNTNQFTIAGGVVFSPNVKVNGADGWWTLTFTLTNTTEYDITLNSLLLDMTMFNASGNNQNPPTYRSTQLTLTTGQTQLDNQNIVLSSVTNSNQNASYLYDLSTSSVTTEKPVLTMGDGGITLEKGTSQTFTLKDSRSTIREGATNIDGGCFFGLKDMVVNYTYEVAGFPTWNGTDGHANWSDATAWTNGIPTAATPAVFNADATVRTVNVDTTGAAATVTVDGAAYTFEGSGSVTAQSLAFTGDGAGLTLGTSMTLSAQSDYAALANVTVAEGGTLAVAAGSKSVINLNAASAGTLEITGGSISNTSAIGTADATLKLDNGTSLFFDNNGNHAFNHDIELGGDATIEVYGSSFHPNGVTITGNVSGTGHMLTKQDLGQLTINGQVNLGTLKLNSASTVIINSAADSKSTIAGLNIANAGAKAELTNTEFSFNGTVKGSVTIGAGSIGTVTSTDSWDYGAGSDITTKVDGGTLAFGGNRWTVHSHNKLVLHNGTVTGAGQSTNGALDFDGSGNVLESSGTSNMEAAIRFRNNTTELKVTDGTLTLSGTLNGGGSVNKTGAGTLVISSNAGYGGSTIVSAGVLTVSSAYSLNSANQLQVNGGTANFNGAVTIGNAGTFSVADGAHLNFGGTVAVTRNTASVRKVGPSRETGNGFGYTYTYASVGAGASGGTWTLNGTESEYDSATGEVGWKVADGSTYYIYTPEAISTVLGKSPSTVVVDTLGATQDLGNGSHSLSRLQIDSGVVTTSHSGANGAINNGEIVINAGGTFRIVGSNDALGWGGGHVTTVTLNGEEGKEATLDLAITSNGSETMVSNLVLNGYAHITDNGTYHKGFNTYGGNITVTGTNNVIEHMQVRKPVTVTVNSGADLVVNTLEHGNNDSTHDFTKAGSGSMTITNSTATLNNLMLNGGTLTFAGGTTTVNGKLITESDNSELVIGLDADHTAVLKVNRMENGNINNISKRSDLTINTGSTLQITGSSTSTDYKSGSFILGEWNVKPSIVTVRGTLVSNLAPVTAGDSGYVMNIDGGTVLVKGLQRKGGDRQQEVNISNGGKLILGDTGIVSTNTGNNVTLTVDSGTIGIYAGSVTIEKAIALSGDVTFDTQQYTVNGTAVAHGTATGDLFISGSLSGDAAIAVTGGGSVTLSGANTITHTIDLQSGTLAMNGGSVTVDAVNMGNFEKFGDSEPTYSHGTSGFLTSSALYYLVKGGSANTATQSGVNLDGGTWAAAADTPDKTAGDLVFKFDTQDTPGGIYYVNENMSTADDAAMTSDASTGFAIKAGVVLTASNNTAFNTNKVLHGAGTYALASGATALNGKLGAGDDWTGAVRLRGITGNGTSLSGPINTIGTATGSWVELNNISGYLGNSSNNSEPVTANLIMTGTGNGGTGDALVINNGFNGASHAFTGSIKGHGDLNQNWNSGSSQIYRFQGDISGWDGSFKTANNTGAVTIYYENGATEINSSINHNRNSVMEVHIANDEDVTVNGNITRSNGTLNLSVEANAAITGTLTNISTLAVTAGHTATLSKAATVGGLTGAGNVVTPMLPPSDTPKVTITLNGTGTGANAYTFGGSLTAHYLNKTGSGTQTFNGDVTLNRLAIGSGTTYFNGAVSVNSQGYSAQGDQVINLSGGSTTYFNGPVTYTNGNNYAILLSGANTTAHFGGTTDLGNKHIGNQANTLVVVDTGASLTLNQFANSSNLGSNGAVTVQSGAYVRTNGAFRTPTLVNNGEIDARNILHVGTMEGSGTITVASTLTVESQSNSSYSGNITAADLTKKNTGKLTLSGVNAFTNATTLSAGTLEVAQVGSLGGQGVNMGDSTSLIFNTAADGIYGGSITGTGSVTKSGAGNLVLTGSNSYTGATAVSGGSLSLLGRNTLGGNITVAENATLKLAASGAPVTTGALTLAENSHLEISGINGTRARSGSSFTVASATGGITLNGVTPTLSGAYSGTVTLSSDGKSLVVDNVAQTGSIYHLYILTGQSNSMGTSKDVPLPQGMLDAYSTEGGTLWNGNMIKGGARYVADPTWQAVEPQLPEISRNGVSSLCMGPEYGFTYMMLEKGWYTTDAFLGQDGLGVMKASLDGGGNSYWVKGNAGGNYDVILDSMQRAILQASQAGYSAVSVDGLMYLQGESDGNDSSVAGTRFAAFLGNLTADLASWQQEQGLDVQLIFSNNAVTGENFSNNTTSQIFLDAATSDGKINADMNGRGHVLTKDLEGIGDGLHYTGNSQLTIGARYAYAFAVQNGIDVGAVRGQDDSKNLNEAGAWWMEALPGEDQVATWDISSVSTVNNIATGETLTVGGIKIDEVYHEGATAKGQGGIAINGGTLSLGSGGIELAGGNLSTTSDVTVRASQDWSALNGHTLATSGTVSIANGATLTIKQGATYTFKAIEGIGSGSLSIEDGVTLGMLAADMEAKPSQTAYFDGAETTAPDGNGYITGTVDLVTLTGEGASITLGENEAITGIDALANATFSVVNGDSGVVLQAEFGSGSTTYYVRNGEVSYDGGSKFTNATEFVLNTMEGAEAPAVLSLSTALPLSMPVKAEGTGGIVSIGSDVVLTQAALDTQNGSISLAGTGTYVLDAKTGDVSWSLPTGVSLVQGENGWKGIVRISGGNFKGNNLDALANTTYSTIELNGVSGWTGYSASTLALNLKLTNSGETSAWKMNAGSSSNNTYDNAPTMTLSGVISGTGNMEKVDGYSESFTFTGNIENWTGKFIQNSSGSRVSRLTFKDGANTINIDTENKTANSKIGIAVGDGTTAFSATFTGESNLQGVDELRVRNNATAVFQGTVNASGVSHLEGNAAVTNSGTMTLNGLTMAEGATFTNTGSLTLNGAITFGADGIANNGESAAITLSSANTFNLSHLTADENGVYTLFTTDSESYVDLSGFHYSVANITGVDDKDSKVWIFGNDGTITGRTASELVWAGTADTHTWTTASGVQDWTASGVPTAFHQGDKVTFAGGETSTTALLAEDIQTAKMTVNNGATLTVQNVEDGHHALEAEELVVNGTLTINGDAGNKSYIAKMTSGDGSTLTLENAVAHLKDTPDQGFAGSLTIGEGATVHVDTTDSLKYSGTRTITVKEGGTLQFNGKRWTVGGSTTIDMQGGLITGNGDSAAALDLIGNSVINATSGDSRIESVIELRYDPTFTVAEGASLEIAGQLKQDGSNRKLTKNGAGTLKFSYTSGNVNQMLINQGALEVYSTLPTINILDFSDNNNATGTLTVKDGGTVTTNQLWLADHTVVTLEQGGTLYTEGMRFNGIAPAEDGQKSILHWIGDATATGNRFYTTTAGFELLHGDLTTNGANKTISMRLTDSTLHVGHNTTVNNAANTITETTLNAGNLTVGADMQLGDVVMNGGNMTVSANTNPTVGAITVNAGKNGTITNNGIISLTEAMTVNGNLTLAGSGEYDLSNMEFDGTSGYTGGEHEEGEDKYNGFSISNGSVHFATVTGTLTGADSANLTYNHNRGQYDAATGDVTFQSADYTKFFVNVGAESVSYAKAQAVQYESELASISLADGATLTVNENISSSLVVVPAGRGTLDIGGAYTVTSDGQGRNITLNGSGTYKLQDTARSLESGVQLGDAAHWTGAVEISGEVAGNHVFQNLSNASSFVKLNGVDTWISPDGTVAANLLLEGKDDGTAAQHSGAGLNIHGADNGRSYHYTGIIKGSGDIAFTQRDHATRSSVFEFTGDLTNWTGDFVNYDGDNGTHPSLRYLTAGDAVIGSGIKQLIFSDKSTSVLDVTYGGENTTSVTVNGNISKAEGSVLNITAAKSTSFNGSLAATSLTLAAGADLALAGETTIGTLTMANGDTLTVNAEGHAVALSNVSGISKTIELTAGTLSFGGTVDITGMSPSGEPEREFVDGMVEGSGNGFLSQSAVYQLVNVGQDVTFDASLSNARFLYDGAEGTLNDDGEVVLSASTSYLTYYVNNAVAEDANVDTLSYAITTAAAQDPAVTLGGVEMKAAGTRLAVDTTASLDTLAVTAGEGSASLINGGEGEHTLTVTNLTAGGKLNVGEGVTLNLATALSGDALNLANLANAGGTVNVALGSDSVLTMDEASTGTLQVRSGELSYRSELGSQTVKLDAGTKLLFGSTAVQGNTDAAEFNHDIVLGGNAEVKVYGNSFHSSSTINGNISGAYTLTKSDVGNLDVNGTVSVASLTIGGTDSTVNFNQAVQLTGTLTVNGGATANFKSDADMSLTTVSISGNNTHASFNGHVTASGNPITVGAATGLSVAFNDGISYTGTGGQHGYALTVGANSTVTLGGTTEVEKFIGPAAAATLVIDEGASVTAPGIFNSRTLTSNGTLNVLSKASVTTTSEFYMMTVNNAGDMTLGGSTVQIDTLNATGGSLTLTATNSLIKTGLTLGAEAGLEVAAGALTISGASTLHNTISNSGTLTFSAGVGITMDASMVQDGAEGYLDTDDDFTSNGNGFSTTRTGKFVTVATGPGSVVASNIAVTAGDGKYYLNNRGVAFAVDAAETVTYDTYYQKSGVADLSDIIAKADGNKVYTVQVGANTQLNLNGYVETVNSIGGSSVQDCAIINLQDGAKVSDVVTQATRTAVVGDLNINGTNTPDLQGDAAQLHMNIGNTLAVAGNVNVDSKVRFVKADGEGAVQVTSIDSQTGAQYTLDKATMMVASDKIQKVAEGDVEVANYTSSRVVDNTEASGSFTLSNASLAMQALEEVHAVTGDISFLNTGNQYEPTLKALEIAGGKTVSFNQAGSIEAMATETTVTVTGTLTAGQGAKLNANLVMEEGSVLDVSASRGVNGLLMGSSVTLKLGETLSETTLAQLPTRLYTKYDLYNGVDTFFLEGFARAQADAPLEYTAWVDASKYYTNVTANEYFICYSGAGTAGGNGGNVGTVYLYRVPEPATSTLSLLALCALAARRRRK